MTVNGGDWSLSTITGIRPVHEGWFSTALKDLGNEQTPTIRIQAKEPVLLLLIGHDVDQSSRPFDLVHILELLQENLHLLSIGGALSDEMETFGVFDTRRGLVGVQGVRHSSRERAMSNGNGAINSRLKVTQVL